MRFIKTDLLRTPKQWPTWSHQSVPAPGHGGHNVHEGHNVRLLSRFFMSLFLRAGEVAKKNWLFIHTYILVWKRVVHFLAHYQFHFHMVRPLRSGLNTSEPRRNFKSKILQSPVRLFLARFRHHWNSKKHLQSHLIIFRHWIFLYLYSAKHPQPNSSRTLFVFIFSHNIEIKYYLCFYSVPKTLFAHVWTGCPQIVLGE